MKKKLLYIFGTRPEAIKLIPLINHTKNNANLEAIVCVTGQHKEMLHQVLSFFSVTPDFDLKLMKHNQDLYDVTSDGIVKLRDIIHKAHPDCIVVQGDTASAFLGALAGYYSKIPVAHIEAGLRSNDKYSPYPEEVYRKLIGHIADYHFAPTEKAAQNLYAENIKENVYVTGNTVIDALFLGLDIIKSSHEAECYDFFNFLNFDKKIVLVTGHRRENFGEPLLQICKSIKHIANEYPEAQFVYPVHLNPNVQNIVNEQLSNISNVFLIAPLDYRHIIWLMKQSYIIITDSGGIQEEAPSLDKPVLVTREVTERVEGIKAGGARLVGTDSINIIKEVKNLFDNKQHYNRMATAVNPYGDGKAGEQTIQILEQKL